MTVDWTHAAPAVLAAALASFVEFVEALTIVLAAGLTRGWPSSLLGGFTGAAVLAAIVALLGRNLRLIPLGVLQLALGILLLAFGVLWLRKAVQRAAKLRGLRDEAKIFARQTREMGCKPRRISSLDALGFITSFKGVFVEGLEVVFIVIAVGAAGGLLLPASLGALAAGVIVVLLGIGLHRPLARVPENLLKFAVGVLLSAFGVFWIGEGAGVRWPLGEWTVLLLIAIIFLSAVSSVFLIRNRGEPS